MMDPDRLDALVRRHFRVYDRRDEKAQGRIIARLHFVMFPAEELEARFDAVRQEILAEEPDALVFMRHEGGEDILVVADRAPVPPRRAGLAVLLFVLTLITTITAGAVYWQGYRHVGQDFSWSVFVDPENLLWGFLTFALPLLLILGIHETAHFIAARRHGLRSSFPYFLPFPPLVLPIGTLGAFISLKDPMPDRKALFDVGASGPLAGFAVAVPVLLLGIMLTGSNAVAVPDMGRPTLDLEVPNEILDDGHGVLKVRILDPDPGSTIIFTLTAPDEGKDWTYNAHAAFDLTDGDREDDTSGTLASGARVTRTLTIPANATTALLEITWDDGLLQFGNPLLVDLIELVGDVHQDDLLTHPTFFAGWVGLLVTGINLLPAGQLDGGHVARAVLGDRMRYAAYAAVGVLMFLAFRFQSWILMALFILFMGIQHPPPLNDRSRLDLKRKVMAGLTLLVFMLTFVARPVIL